MLAIKFGIQFEFFFVASEEKREDFEKGFHLLISGNGLLFLFRFEGGGEVESRETKR